MLQWTPNTFATISYTGIRQQVSQKSICHRSSDSHVIVRVKHEHESLQLSGYHSGSIRVYTYVRYTRCRARSLVRVHAGRSLGVREPIATTKGMGHSTRCGEWRARWQLHRQINHEVNTLLKLATADAARGGCSRMILVAG